MKRVIKAGIDTNYSKEEIMKSADGEYVLIKEQGVGRDNTPYKALRVQSKGSADKHVVEVRLKLGNFPNFEGDPVLYKYSGVYVSHGMRSQMDTLEETEEYIQCLQSALEFAKQVEEYLPEWNDKELPPEPFNE